jgi:hypothetical protein
MALSSKRPEATSDTDLAMLRQFPWRYLGEGRLQQEPVEFTNLVRLSVPSTSQFGKPMLVAGQVCLKR